MLPALLLALALAQAPPPPPFHLGKVKGVPLVEVPSQAPGRDKMAVLLTGDGGWAITDKGLSEALARGGIPVVGWNSLHSFLPRKAPDRNARNLERVLRVYLPFWH